MVDVTIDLVGTAPFDFEWRRYKLEWDARNKVYFKGAVLESHNVYGVNEHKYFIHTSTEGIIEVINCIYLTLIVSYTNLYLFLNFIAC